MTTQQEVEDLQAKALGALYAKNRVLADPKEPLTSDLYREGVRGLHSDDLETARFHFIAAYEEAVVLTNAESVRDAYLPRGEWWPDLSSALVEGVRTEVAKAARSARKATS